MKKENQMYLGNSYLMEILPMLAQTTGAYAGLPKRGNNMGMDARMNGQKIFVNFNIG